MDADDRIAALNETIRRFGEAWASGDTATLDAMLSPTYTHTDAYGAFQDRAAWLDYASKRSGRATRISFRDVHIRLVSDTAVVTGVNEVHGDGARDASDRSTLTIRFTQVWRWSDRGWLREAFQATPINRGSPPFA
jgi:ketosteroid isomerase-like protein